MGKISASFMAAGVKSVFNSSEWKPVGDPVSLVDFLNAMTPGLGSQIEGNKAEVVAVEFGDGSVGNRLEIPFKDGNVIQLKLSGKSSLSEGDYVDISTITGQELKKIGQDNIVRFDGKILEEE